MINREMLKHIVEFIDVKGLSEATLAELRLSFPGCHFTWCFDDDIVYSKAYLERDDFNVYLVDSRNHCAELTSDESIASGLVFAEIVA